MGKISDALAKSNIDHTTIPKAAGPDSAAAADGLADPQRVPIQREDIFFDQTQIDKGLVTLLKPYSYEAEQFKKLRTNILFPDTGTPPRSILVTSAVPSEGKTFVAANLSISIAQNVDKNVLLMDCDMRKPSLHECFGFGRLSGLSEYLSQGQKLEGLLSRTVVDRLTLLSSGEPPDNPSELLSSKRMADLLKEVMTRYLDRYVVIDAPPPQLCAETAAIARQVDGILLVIKYGSTKQEAVEELIDLLGKKNILGVVFNKFDPKISPYSYDGYATYEKKK